MAPPTARDVHVWRIELLGDAERYVASLSPGEHIRLERLRGEQRDRFAISHGAMRQVLGAYLGCAPADVPLESPSGQPPSIVGLELSLTHCDRLALLAVALTPVGVDVEATRHVASDELAELAEATLAPAELRQFLMTPSEDQTRAWLRSWVRKEAVLKARREGLGDRSLSELDVSADRVGDLTLVDLDVGPSHLAAAAVTPPAARVALKDWSGDSR
jgi:4'-phosphopantetheinyl transferase